MWYIHVFLSACCFFLSLKPLANINGDGQRVGGLKGFRSVNICERAGREDVLCFLTKGQERYVSRYCGCGGKSSEIAGIFSIVCAAPTPTGCALLSVMVVSKTISFKGPGISITVESKERAWLVGSISQGFCSLDGCPLARICLTGTFPKQLQGDEN